MPIREQDIADRLAAVAAQVTGPRFRIESVARRIRLRRARLVAIAGMSTAAVAVLAVAVLTSLGTGSHPEGPGTPLPPAVWLPMKISVLGQTADLVTGPSPRSSRFFAPAGRAVSITVQVTVPHGIRVRTLRFGIVTADVAAGGPRGPTGWAVVLLRTTKPLTSGKQIFRLRWAAAGALRPGSKVYLIAYWVAGRSAPEPIIASLILRRA
jgi:hypothetical protein